MVFAPPTATQPGLWRRTPPAIFPPLLGLLGLALGWRRGAAEFGLPAGVGEMAVGAVTLLALFCLLTYATKLLRRPAVVLEDLRILPGRAGLGAAVLCLYLLAAALGPLAPGVARGGLMFGIAAHLALTGALVFALATGPAEQRRVNPVWHLLFSGWVVAAMVATPLGFLGLATGLFWAALVVAVVLWTLSLQQFARETVPAPLRPLLAIHLAPAAVLGTTALALGGEGIAQTFALVSALGLLVLVARARWLLAAGFSPLWGALTFPLAATATLWLGLGGFWRLPGGILLVMATLFIVPVAVRLFKMWAKGDLAAKTGAATA